MIGGLEQAFAVLGIAGGLVLNAFATFFSRFHWLSLLSAALLAFACWLYQRRRDPSLRSTGFLAFLFPRKVWLHRSALLDYRFVLFDKVALGVLIGFVGLIVPHLCRLLVGVDHRWLLPYSAVAGACLLIVADIIGRIAARPAEIDVGIVTAFVGAPFFIWIVRRQRVREL